METIYFWPDRPALSLLVLWLVSQVFLYAARVPMHRALRNIGHTLGGAFRIVARLSKGTALELRRRNREVLLAAGRTEGEQRLEREFARLATTFNEQLKAYPGLHRGLDDNLQKLERDLKESGMSPPEVPGWPEAVQAVAAMPKAGDRGIQKVLDEIHKSAVASEKKALQEYREATQKRHKILAAVAPLWKELRTAMDQTLKAVTGTLAATTRIDGYMERYEQIRRGEDTAERALAASALNLFLISLFVVAVAGFGALVNFQLIARPMSELVAGGGYIFGMPISMIAALVVVLMEVAAGIFVMETLGITNLFPKLSGLALSKRRIIFVVALAGLFLLASIEASLAILREQLLEADKALTLALAGQTAVGTQAVAEPLLSKIPVIGQAVLGFILPWILAMIAVPLEMLVESGRHVGGRVLVLGIFGFGFLMRLIAHGVRYAMAVLAHVYDVYIIVPLQIERQVRGRGAPSYSPVEGGAVRNPADRTGQHKVQR